MQVASILLVLIRTIEEYRYLEWCHVCDPFPRIDDMFLFRDWRSENDAELKAM